MGVNMGWQLEEILSWRFMTELWRYFPHRFDLIEAHCNLNRQVSFIPV